MLFLKITLIGLIILPITVQAVMLSIQVKQTTLRSKPSFLGKTIQNLSYAQKVEEKKIQNGWHYVKTLDSGVDGWLHGSALSTKEIVLSVTGKVSTDVSQSEVLMAGKGFNKQVEDAYKKTNNSLNFSLVDTIEKTKLISNESLNNFVNNGKLKI